MLSGWKINLSKFSVYKLNATFMAEGEIASFPCVVVELLISLVPLKHALNHDTVQPLVDIFATDWLNGMELAYLGEADGCLSLLLVLLCPYIMLFFLLPQWVIDEIDKLRRAFLWKGYLEVSGGVCLVNWSQVCKLKSQGGFGICDLWFFNTSLLSKWWLLLFQEDLVASLPYPVPDALHFAKGY